MIELILAATINTQPITNLPTNKKDWVIYNKEQCDESNIGKTETEMEWFGRCFTAKFAYFEWLQKYHPRDYEKIQEEQDRKVREILRQKY